MCLALKLAWRHVLLEQDLMSLIETYVRTVEPFLTVETATSEALTDLRYAQAAKTTDT